MQLPEGCSPAAADADLLLGQDQTEQGYGMQGFERRKAAPGSERCSGDGHQKVDGNGIDIQVAKRKGHLDAVLHAFAQTEDAAAAGRKTNGAARSSGQPDVRQSCGW